MKAQLEVPKPLKIPVVLHVSATLGQLRDIRADVAAIAVPKEGTVKFLQLLDAVEAKISTSYLAYTPDDTQILDEVEVT